MKYINENQWKTIDIKEWEYNLLKKYINSGSFYSENIKDFADVIEQLIYIGMREGFIPISDIAEYQRGYNYVANNKIL